MAYVDGFLIPVPTKNLANYRKIAQKAGEVWMEHGALDYKECIGDDVNVEGMGTMTSFPKTLAIKRGETVVFSWILYKNRAHRDSVNKKVMADPRLAKMMNPKTPPFDHKRMNYGGFEVLVDMAPAKAKKALPKKKAKKSR
ncbi:MAG: DUF1428 domain-containing protein [Hyphomonadaceae bacterium]